MIRIKGGFKMRKTGFLWKHETANEIILKGYIDAGILGRINIKCLVNKRKDRPEAPDYDIILVGPQDDKKVQKDQS